MSHYVRWVAFMCAVALPAPFAVAQVYDFESQFSTATNPSGAWSYRYQADGSSDNTVRDGYYELLSNPSSSTGGGTITGWDATAGATLNEPHVVKNVSGSSFVCCAGTLTVPVGVTTAHPNPNQSVIVSWTAPSSGTANLNFSFTDQNSGGGNGVRYFVERGSKLATLATGTIANGGPTAAGGVNGVRVTAGETINFIVDPIGGDHGADSTRITANVNFAAGAVPFTTYRAAADLAAFEAVNSGAVAAVNGAWSYGTTPTLGGAFTTFAASEHNETTMGGLFVNSGTMQGWSEPGGDLVPFIAVNTTGVPQPANFSIISTDPDQIVIHPGEPSGTRDYSVVRWTSPGEGFADILANWTQKGQGGVFSDVDVLINGVLAPGSPGLASYDDINGDGTSFSLLNYALKAGDTIDFVVGPNAGNYAGTSTGFDAEIRFTATPEPVAIAQWLLAGGLCLVFAGWGRVRGKKQR